MITWAIGMLRRLKNKHKRDSEDVGKFFGQGAPSSENLWWVHKYHPSLYRSMDAWYGTGNILLF